MAAETKWPRFHDEFNFSVQSLRELMTKDSSLAPHGSTVLDYDFTGSYYLVHLIYHKLV